MEQRRLDTILEAVEGVDVEKPPKALLDSIAKLGLNDNLRELNEKGYTIVRGAITQDQVERAKRAIVAKAQKQTGKKVDLDSESGTVHAGMEYVHNVLFEDAIFEEILMAPKPLELITYLLGKSALLASMGCHFKGPGGAALNLHTDNGNGMVQPFRDISEVANVNYALTPYTREAGATALVPGSFRLRRSPTPKESILHGPKANTAAVPADMMPGDCVVWHGNTWHGSYKREIPGIRVNLAMLFNRQYIVTQETLRGQMPDEVRARRKQDRRFLTLLGEKQAYNFSRTKGPDYGKFALMPRGRYD